MTDNTPSRIYLAAVHTGMSTRYEQVGPEDMGAEEWWPAGSGVRVKPLEWREGKHYGAKGRTLFATSIFGAYEVTTGWENGKASAHLSYAETAWLPDEAAAIAFVQGAHDARIRAALEPVAQPEPAPDQAEQMRRAIEDVIAGRGFDADPWRSIENDPPPKDGGNILGSMGGKIPFVMAWCDDLAEETGSGWFTFNQCYETTIQRRAKTPWMPTHWTPLPKPPGETTSAIPDAVKARLRSALMVGGRKGDW